MNTSTEFLKTITAAAPVLMPSTGDAPHDVRAAQTVVDGTGAAAADHAVAAQYPTLAALRLTAADVDALRANGFVAAERRGERLVFKLRFRRQRQIVRYVGSAARAAAVRAELACLQSSRRHDQELRQLTQTCRLALRDSKQQLEPLLAARGLKFHGRTIRRPRLPRNH